MPKLVGELEAWLVWGIWEVTWPPAGLAGAGICDEREQVGAKARATQRCDNGPGLTSAMRGRDPRKRSRESASGAFFVRGGQGRFKGCLEERSVGARRGAGTVKFGGIAPLRCALVVDVGSIAVFLEPTVLQDTAVEPAQSPSSSVACWPRNRPHAHGKAGRQASKAGHNPQRQGTLLSTPPKGRHTTCMMSSSRRMLARTRPTSQPQPLSKPRS